MNKKLYSKIIYKDSFGYVVKVLENGLGEFGVFYGIDKATHQAYKKYFKKKNTAIKYAHKFVTDKK